MQDVAHVDRGKYGSKSVCTRSSIVTIQILAKVQGPVHLLPLTYESSLILPNVAFTENLTTSRITGRVRRLLHLLISRFILSNGYKGHTHTAVLDHRLDVVETAKSGRRHRILDDLSFDRREFFRSCYLCS